MRAFGKTRRALRIALRAAGLERARHPTFADLMRKLAIDTVIDVGANAGQYVGEIRELGYRGRIVSFEPIHVIYERLADASRTDELWSVHNVALGESAGEQLINVSENTVFSSFKPASSYLTSTFKSSTAVRTESVKVIRLEDFLNEHPEYGRSTYLKIDTQGFEMEVLKGAGAWLSQIKALQLELPIRSLYEGQVTWISMVEWLAGQGFQIAMAKENGYDQTTLSLLELDVVFVRTEA
jgi:FkbM family methyltransferase